MVGVFIDAATSIKQRTYLRTTATRGPVGPWLLLLENIAPDDLVRLG